MIYNERAGQALKRESGSNHIHDYSGVAAMADESLAGKFYVYVHSRLNTGTPFYVGKGHARRAYTHKSRRPHWKNIVAKDGGFYTSFIALDLDEEFAMLLEMETIDKYRRAGVALVNRTDGGEGVTGYRHLRPPHNKGKPCPPEMRARISATLKANGCLPPIGWNRGKKTPRDVIEKRRPAMLAAWAKAKADGTRAVSPETREKMRVAKLGHIKSEETRRRMSIAMKANKYVRKRPDMTGFKHSAESRAKMSDSMKGRPSHNKGVPMPIHVRDALVASQKRRTNFAHSWETKRKIGAAHKGRKASPETCALLSKMRRKAVRCVETGETFESAMAAAKWLGLNQKTQVNACCTGRLKIVRGFTFRHAEVAGG